MYRLLRKSKEGLSFPPLPFEFLSIVSRVLRARVLETEEGKLADRRRALKSFTICSKKTRFKSSTIAASAAAAEC